VSAVAADAWEPARVIVVEPMGNELLLTIEYRGQRLVSRAVADLAVDSGQAVWVHLPPARVQTCDGEGTRVG
jgi:ABC-type sugar transport system ATPase subunit